MHLQRQFVALALALLTIVSACKGGGPETTKTPTPNRTLIQGSDLSFSPEMKNLGINFYDQNTSQDPINILQQHGQNLVRLKLWVTPTDPYNNLEHVAQMALQARNLGMQWMLDFHFSDTWADPSHQHIPSTWQGQDYATMLITMESYTKLVIETLEAQDTLPNYVQIGNEISCGMLWPMANVCDANDTPEQWSKLTGLIAAANSGIDKGTLRSNSIKRIIHLDSGGDNAKCRWFFEHLKTANTHFDIIGLSYYPWWHGTLQDLSQNLNDLATRYNKPVMVVETSYPWTLSYSDNMNNIVGNNNQLLSGYPATPAGQSQYLKDLRQIVLEVPNQLGVGIVYWAPDWLGNNDSGSSYENMALFDFEGKVLPAANNWGNP